jgi:sulfate/thiosulfate transport system ATP-binding protein
MSIEIRNLKKSFGKFTALKDIDLTIGSGELVALLGPSGCGKTTLLRIIAGLEAPDRGTLFFHGEETTQRHVRERQVGFVFQHYALFRHMTVFENVAFGLRVRPRQSRPAEAELSAKVHELLTLVQLDQFAQRYPSQLSGGQRQRVALARALAVEPKVLLLDEPFGALDARVRKELRRWLRCLHDELHVTSVFVTHDQEEALEVADRVVVMNQGRIEQIGTPDEVYENPVTPFVYQFLGDVNLFHGRVNDGWGHMGSFQIQLPAHQEIKNAEAIAYVRPHDLDISRDPGEAAIEAIIHQIRLLGPLTRLSLHVAGNGDKPVAVEIGRARSQELALQEGERVFIKPRNLQVFLAKEQSASVYNS